MERRIAKGVLSVAGCLVVAACSPADRDGPRPERADVPARGGDGAAIEALLDSLPVVAVPDLDREMALTLAAMPLSCLDRPHAAQRDRRSYLDTLVVTRVPGFEESRAFYGCWDWHSAVNSTWAMVRLYKEFPELPVGGLIDEKLDDHLAAEALEGELAFFEGNRTFERPYGWAWLMKLHAELSSWEHRDAETWAERLDPVVALFSERTIEWLDDLKVPSRSGAHSNTAFALAMMLESARSVRDRPLEEAISSAARRLFGDDFGCPTAYEPWGSDFLSPCLEEAALMAAVLEPEAYLAWLEDFLPPMTSREFRPLTRPTDPDAVVSELDPSDDRASPGRGGDADESAADRRAAEETRVLAATSHLIGLAFIRADAMNRIAEVLPESDPRVGALRRIARLHASRGFDAMFEADYAGSHWIGTFAVKYLLTRGTEP